MKIEGSAPPPPPPPVTKVEAPQTKTISASEQNRKEAAAFNAKFKLEWADDKVPTLPFTMAEYSMKLPIPKDQTVALVDHSRAQEIKDKVKFAHFAAGGFEQVKSNFELKVIDEIPTKSNTNPKDIAKLGNTGFSFFLPVIGTENTSAYRGFLSDARQVMTLDESLTARGDVWLSKDMLDIAGDEEKMREAVSQGMRGHIDSVKNHIANHIYEVENEHQKPLSDKEMADAIDQLVGGLAELKVPGSMPVTGDGWKDNSSFVDKSQIFGQLV